MLRRFLLGPRERRPCPPYALPLHLTCSVLTLSSVRLPPTQSRLPAHTGPLGITKLLRSGQSTALGPGEGSERETWLVAFIAQWFAAQQRPSTHPGCRLISPVATRHDRRHDRPDRGTRAARHPRGCRPVSASPADSRQRAAPERSLTRAIDR